MSGIIANLKMFNSKERFYLLGMALGKPQFHLGDKFRQELSKTFGLTVPQNAFVAMDYHLDWIYASLFLFFNGDSEGVHSNADKLITGTQKDIDLLVAYETEGAYHVVMLEAKGVLSFENKPLNDKAKRLKLIFERFQGPGRQWKAIVPHFAIVSPKKPRRLRTSDWPSWMKLDGEHPRWIQLVIPDGLKKVTRCDEGKRSSNTGKFWEVDPR